MIMHEDFIRCPKCEQPYFRKNTYVTLDKMFMENNPPIPKENKVIIDYICMSCGHIIVTLD